MPVSIWKSKYKYIRILIVLVIFGFIFKRVADDWDKIIAQPLHIDYVQLFLSYIGLCLVYILCAIFWRQILNRFQSRLTLLQGMRVWLYSQLGKYLPGKGFIYLGRTFLCQKYGIDSRNSLASSAVEVGLHFLSASILILVSLPFLANFPNFIHQWWIVLFVLFGLVIMHPRLFTFIINKALTLFKKQKIELNMTYAEMIRYLFVYLFLQFLAGLSFLFFVRTFSPVSLENAIFVIISFIAAYLIGALSFLAPAGLGVREGILLILLNNVIPSAVVVQVALFSRLWTVIADLGGAGSAFALRKIDGS